MFGVPGGTTDRHGFVSRAGSVGDGAASVIVTRSPRTAMPEMLSALPAWYASSPATSPSTASRQ